MSRILLTVSFVMDIDPDDHFQLVTSVDHAIRESLQGVLRARGVQAEDLEEGLQFYGTHVHPQWDLADFLSPTTGDL